MRCFAPPVERRCDVAKKKKEELPVFVVVDMPEWKSKILDFMLKILRVPGKSWVIGIEETGFTYDGDYYTDTTTNTKISRKLVSDAQGD